MNDTTQTVVDGVVVATSRHVDLADVVARRDVRASAMAALDMAAGILGGAPSVARLRAALILLEGMTDDTLVDATADTRAALTTLLDAVDDGIV